MKDFLKGKKTYIGAALIAFGAAAGFIWGPLDAHQLTIAFGVALAITGLGSKLERYLPIIVRALEELKRHQARAVLAAEQTAKTSEAQASKQ